MEDKKYSNFQNKQRVNSINDYSKKYYESERNFTEINYANTLTDINSLKNSLNKTRNIPDKYNKSSKKRLLTSSIDNFSFNKTNPIKNQTYTNPNLEDKNCKKKLKIFIIFNLFL